MRKTFAGTQSHSFFFFIYGTEEEIKIVVGPPPSLRIVALVSMIIRWAHIAAAFNTTFVDFKSVKFPTHFYVKDFGRSTGRNTN